MQQLYSCAREKARFNFPFKQGFDSQRDSGVLISRDMQGLTLRHKAIKETVRVQPVVWTVRTERSSFRVFHPPSMHMTSPKPTRLGQEQLNSYRSHCQPPPPVLPALRIHLLSWWKTTASAPPAGSSPSPLYHCSQTQLRRPGAAVS